MIGFDTECTGLDLHHGAKPFLVTTCTLQGDQVYWEWNVDPDTRQPSIPKDDIAEIRKVMATERLVLQNSKFDSQALATIGINNWPWEYTHDTLLAGHLLASNHAHDLTSMALEYLAINIDPLDKALEKAVKECQRLCRSKLPKWRIASKDLPEMPSAKEKVWKFDSWLPRAVAKHYGYPVNHPYWTVCSEYANGDSSATILLFKVQRALLQKRGLWRIYQERLKLLPVVYAMEQYGITISQPRLKELQVEYKTESAKAGIVCMRIADSLGCSLELPKSGNNNSLTSFVFGALGLKPTKRSKRTDAPSLDKTVIEHYEATLPENSDRLKFVKALQAKRRRGTALSYMESYEKFWLATGHAAYYVLHPSLNMTGTDTLRFSSQNPNEQNISKKEGFNLRYCFGPAPGREWWSLDAQNIELRIPAFEANEPEMTRLFNNPQEAPYFGSYHMLIFATLHPEKFAKHGMKCKEVYKSTYYQWTKNGNFAIQYGAQESSGTADRAYHVPGAQHRIQSQFAEIGKLSQRWINFANTHGYVETMPDKTVDHKHGYPLLCTRSDRGNVLPTVPLSYHVQGTAMWWMSKAMVRCQEYLSTLDVGCYMVMQVHDELVFDFPYRANMGNRTKVRVLKGLMEQGGDDIGVPTSVSCEYHKNTWSEGIVVQC